MPTFTGKTPVSPNEVMKTTGEVPDQVISAVDELLRQKFASGKSQIVLTLREVEAAIVFAGIDRTDLAANPQWLNFERLYRENGWKCDYHSPDRDESFEPFYEFSKK